MLFVTNRAIKQSVKSKKGRRIDFNLKDTEAQQSVYFCRRAGHNEYEEIMSTGFMEALRESKAKQILILVHGFSNLPEDSIFPRAQALQELFDSREPRLVEVVPLIWPCADDLGIIKDYWDDQKAADASAFAFSRVLEKFRHWRDTNAAEGIECVKRINVLAHSMGNRVFRETLAAWTKYDLGQSPPLLFRNAFMVASDVVNETLEKGERGEPICAASRNVVVYYASDDLALRASKVSNLKNRIASRRLGHTGPEDMNKVPSNVFAIDCDEVNTRYDSPKGHSYFLHDEHGRPGVVFDHIFHCVQSGRVPVGSARLERSALLGN